MPGAGTSATLALPHMLPFPPPVHTSTGRPSRRARAASESSSAPVLWPPGSGHTSTATPRTSIDSSQTYLDPDAKSLGSDVDAESEYRRWGHSAGGDKGQPPPYVERSSYTHAHAHTAVPAEEQAQEARTLPMYMFILGFVCPVLWLIGAFTLRAPHAHRAGVFDPYASLNGAEKAEAEREMRRWEVETRWGKRCMWAAVVSVFLGLAAGMAAWGAIASGKGKGDQGALAA
ncbi:hypothetical protein D9615_005680 [Tricholomella constricta]|uniref:Uncharacterized protein n=1 Tax=Tricholomella constricta TaxID=117010 RepID=A0A8H5M3V9_9AGAR|nr:hypothetical protein D9615_005680 [Tricholomella constricta]